MSTAFFLSDSRCWIVRRECSNSCSDAFKQPQRFLEWKIIWVGAREGGGLGENMASGFGLEMGEGLQVAKRVRNLLSCSKRLQTFFKRSISTRSTSLGELCRCCGGGNGDRNPTKTLWSGVWETERLDG